MSENENQSHHHKKALHVGRFYAKKLFITWFVLIAILSGVLFFILPKNCSPELMPVILVLFILIMFIGVYTFQSITRINKRIDAALKIIEEKEKQSSE